MVHGILANLRFFSLSLSLNFRWFLRVVLLPEGVKTTRSNRLKFRLLSKCACLTSLFYIHYWSCSNYKSEYGNFMIHFSTLNVFTDLGISLSLNLTMCLKRWREQCIMGNLQVRDNARERGGHTRQGKKFLLSPQACLTYLQGRQRSNYHGGLDDDLGC